MFNAGVCSWTLVSAFQKQRNGDAYIWPKLEHTQAKEWKIKTVCLSKTYKQLSYILNFIFCFNSIILRSYLKVIQAFKAENVSASQAQAGSLFHKRGV